jgi:hypothetical protein
MQLSSEKRDRAAALETDINLVGQCRQPNFRMTPALAPVSPSQTLSACASGSFHKAAQTLIKKARTRAERITVVARGCPRTNNGHAVARCSHRAVSPGTLTLFGSTRRGSLVVVASLVGLLVTETDLSGSL